MRPHVNTLNRVQPFKNQLQVTVVNVHHCVMSLCLQCPVGRGDGFLIHTTFGKQTSFWFALLV